MKKIRLIPIMIFFMLFLALTANASDINKEITSSIDNELNSFKNSLPEYAKEFFPQELLNGEFTGLIDGSIDERTFLEYAVSYLLSGIDTVLKSFASILVLIIISGIFNTISSSLLETNVNHAFSICSALCVAISVFNICSILATNTTKYIQILCNVMNAFLPLIVVLLTMGGSISSATVSNGSMLLFINVVEGFLLTFMLPLVKMCLAFGCVKSLGNGCDFGGISKSVKTTFTSVTVFIMSIFMFVLSFKSTLSQSVDTISLKTARFAISSFVPLVGSSVNEALRTVTYSLSLIKNSCGIVAIIIVVVIMLPIIINLFLNKLSFNILSALSRLIGVNNESGILEEADSVCGFLLTLVCCTCVLFIFALTIFIKTGIEAGA